jgi:hypothetical protein
MAVLPDPPNGDLKKGVTVAADCASIKECGM